MKKLTLVMCALLVAAPAVGQTLYATDAGLDAPVRMYPVNREEALFESGLAGEPQPLTLTFRLENKTGESVEDVLVTAYVFSDQGLPRGFHSYLVQESIPPLSTTYFHYVTGELKVHAGDRVIPVVEEARSGANNWRLDESWTGDAILGSTYFADDIGRFLQKGPDSACEGKCAARQTKCDNSCSRCTEFSFGCTCGSDGTITSTCTCKSCKPVV